MINDQVSGFSQLSNIRTEYNVAKIGPISDTLCSLRNIRRLTNFRDSVMMSEICHHQIRL